MGKHQDCIGLNHKGGHLRHYHYLIVYKNMCQAKKRLQSVTQKCDLVVKSGFDGIETRFNCVLHVCESWDLAVRGTHCAISLLFLQIVALKYLW